MKRLKSWISSKVIVKNPAIHGKGMFAKEPIKKGEVVSKYGGYLASSLTTWLSHYLIGDYDWQISKNRFLVPLSKNDLEPTNYLNHSCDPNLGCQSQRAIVALRNIKKGEELAIDYAMVATDEPYFFLPFTPPIPL